MEEVALGGLRSQAAQKKKENGLICQHGPSLICCTLVISRANALKSYLLCCGGHIVEYFISDDDLLRVLEIRMMRLNINSLECLQSHLKCLNFVIDTLKRLVE